MLKTTFDHGHALYMGNKTRRNDHGGMEKEMWNRARGLPV